MLSPDSCLNFDLKTIRVCRCVCVRKISDELLYLYEPTIICEMGLFISSLQGYSETKCDNSCESALEIRKHCT